MSRLILTLSDFIYFEPTISSLDCEFMTLNVTGIVSVSLLLIATSDVTSLVEILDKPFPKVIFVV